MIAFCGIIGLIIKYRLINMQRNNTKKTTEQFVKEANQTHGFKYLYPNTQYVNAHTKVEIECKTHGTFHQKANDHLRGLGCSKCKTDNLIKRQSDTAESFSKKAAILHNNFYDYSKINYIDSKTPVEVICPLHGSFTTTPSSHISRKSRCPTCTKIKNVELNMRSYSDWEKAGTLSKKFKAYTLYLIEMYEESGEKFLKVGKTYTSIDYRFRNNPYNFTILYTFEGPALEVSQKEEDLKRNWKKFYYKPLKEFGGMFECYDYSYKELLLKDLTSGNNKLDTS